MEDFLNHQDCWRLQRWPTEVEKIYKPLQIMGEGSYGVVWKAKKRDKSKKKVQYVAIKHMSIRGEKDVKYIKREISILQQLDHPHIIRVIENFLGEEESVSHFFSVMTLASGPNIQTLIDYGGALGLPLAQMICRQLVSAVSYLHGRAVLHRDIKPENCILARNDAEETKNLYLRDFLVDAIWSDGADCQSLVDLNTWKVILVDFGFARALQPSEVAKKEQFSATIREGQNSIPSEQRAVRSKSVRGTSTLSNGISKTSEETLESDFVDSFTSQTTEKEKSLRRTSLSRRSTRWNSKNTLESQEMEAIQKAVLRFSGEILIQSDSGDISEEAVPFPKRRSSMSQVPEMLIEPLSDEEAKKSRRFSYARRRVRMSAVGTPLYTAPEIALRKKKKKNQAGQSKKKSAFSSSRLSEYGMLADAYSLGLTFKEVLTGVPPDKEIDKYIKRYAQVSKRNQFVCCFSKKRRTKIYKQWNEIPDDCVKLVSSMTMPNEEDRMSVREAQQNPWICANDYVLPRGDFPCKVGDKVMFLDLTSKKKEKKVAMDAESSHEH